ncbi:MAG: hypothetical protein JRE64_01445 [Deltaproteobacteria bacterium]|nr:hypothetical protein [Deltaproteobacteria bacterium]
MKLITPYLLPYKVKYRVSPLSVSRDLILQVHLVEPVSKDASDAIKATVLPLLLMGSSGALSGESIEPWNSEIRGWSGPVIQNHKMEWRLSSVRIDPQAWVMLAQMLLDDNEKYRIDRIEVLDPQCLEETVTLVTHVAGANPYPGAWKGIKFSIDIDDDLYQNFTVYATFSRELTEEEQVLIDELLSSWAPGPMVGAYGVAPIPPSKCIGFPDEKIVFIENQLEWAFSDFRAHTGALDGLINVFASISETIVPIVEVQIV